jgi:MSHA biogenesis protein MshK
MNMKPHPLAVTAMLLAGLASAQGLPDPTRPPVIVLDAASAGTTQPTVPAPSGLQSIVRRQGGKSAAVINGSYVELGGKVGDATLERVGEDSVDLRSATGRETLYLTPGVGKKVAPTDSSVAKRPRGKLEKARP